MPVSGPPCGNRGAAGAERTAARHRSSARSVTNSDCPGNHQSMMKLRPTALSRVALAACKETDQVWSPTTPSAALLGAGAKWIRTLGPTLGIIVSRSLLSSRPVPLWESGNHHFAKRLLRFFSVGFLVATIRRQGPHQRSRLSSKRSRGNLALYKTRAERGKHRINTPCSATGEVPPWTVRRLGCCRELS
jgi:hypothetical protein